MPTFSPKKWMGITGSAYFPRSSACYLCYLRYSACYLRLSVSMLRRSPKSQTPFPAEREPRLRLERRKRPEDDKRYRNKHPLQNIEKVMMPTEPFRPRRQKKNAYDCRARDANHRKLNYEFCYLGQAIREKRSVEMSSAHQHRQPAQRENHQ